MDLKTLTLGQPPWSWGALRGRLAAVRLFDITAVARELEAAYESMLGDKLRDKRPRTGRKE